MTVSERIFELIRERGYTQKEFSRKTGIAESTISDWKKKNTNPVSDKILIICEVLDVSPYFLLSGAENKGERSRENRTFVVSKESDSGELVSYYDTLDEAGKKDALKYLKKLASGKDKETAVKNDAGADDNDKTEVKDKPRTEENQKTKGKGTDVKEKDASADKGPILPDIKTIASEESDYLIKDDKADKEKKKKDKSKDKEKDKDKDKKKKKDKDKKKKKKGYLLER